MRTIEKKKMGRPTDDPKTIVKQARMSEDDVKKLNKCCDILQLTASDVIRLGIQELYEKIV